MSEEKPDLHPLTELMLARMKSHPEEFRLTRTEDVFHVYRWDVIVTRIQNYGSEADKQALADGLNPIRMDEAHEWAMDELLNGEERRRKLREEEDAYERKLALQNQMYQQQAMTNQAFAQTMQTYKNSLATATGVSPTSNPKSILGGLFNRSKP